MRHDGTAIRKTALYINFLQRSRVVRYEAGSQYGFAGGEVEHRVGRDAGDAVIHAA